MDQPADLSSWNFTDQVEKMLKTLLLQYFQPQIEIIFYNFEFFVWIPIEVYLDLGLLVKSACLQLGTSLRGLCVLSKIKVIQKVSVSQ